MANVCIQTAWELVRQRLSADRVLIWDTESHTFIGYDDYDPPTAPAKLTCKEDLEKLYG